MTCKEIQALIPEILREPGKHPAAEAHIAQCGNCREELRFVRTLQQGMLHAYPRPPLTETIPERLRLLRRLRNRRLTRPLVYAAGLAALIVFAVFSPRINMQGQKASYEPYTYYETETLDAMMAVDISEGMKVSDEEIAVYLIENASLGTIEELSF